jgi:hypothetical protein
VVVRVTQVQAAVDGPVPRSVPLLPELRKALSRTEIQN